MITIAVMVSLNSRIEPAMKPKLKVVLGKTDDADTEYIKKLKQHVVTTYMQFTRSSNNFCSLQLYAAQTPQLTLSLS